ncbi:MAG: 4-hydroxythreonine-4-phosphate dehydrogenase PdxA [Proteobacteria bacterium]|nr:4-hydroxythreonine-4-phosphate dehydrogenase PdxA [Pseudomonadota bacterium]
MSIFCPGTSFEPGASGGNMGRPKRIAIAPGDPAGIGYEISVQALSEIRESLKDCIIIIYAQHTLWKRAETMFAPQLGTIRILSADQGVEPGMVYLIDPDTYFEVGQFKPGEIQAQNARCAYKGLMQIISDVKSDLIDGICTGPIHKGAMRQAGIQEIGHTEMLAKGFECDNPLTMFQTRKLRIFFYSRHLSLREAIDALNTEGLVEFGMQMDDQMRRLGFTNPHLAMAALNPHASDGGQFGTEEREILLPASSLLRTRGIDISDPIGADSVFAQASQGRYDAVLSLYHDQGHIAAKTYDFERTISLTLGLPCLRTSVDHGTAFDIAWQGLAQTISMRTAIENMLEYLK